MVRRNLSKFDYYAELGIKSDATIDEIKRAYRRKAMKHHPDKNPGDKKAEAKFKRCAEAYEVLSDPDLRKQYDDGEHYQVSTEASAPNGKGKSVGSGFVDFLKTANPKKVKNPFTIYRKGRTK